MSAEKNKNKQKNPEQNKKIALIVAVSAILFVVAVAIVGTAIAHSKEEKPVIPTSHCSRERLWDCPVVDKPILYLYPTEETKINVSFANPSQLTTTYPKYYGGWTVTAQPNGNLTDINGNNYYALYWEENSEFRPDTETAFYVTKDNAIDFLESKLTLIGLNERERNEFIMYWLPILEENEQSLVRFAYTDELQADNELKISPKPDSLLRVRIFVEKTDSNPNLPEPTINHFERNGFTAVEWGGTSY